MKDKFVDIKYLKEFTNGALRINKNGSLMQDDYIVTYDDIYNELFFPYFKDNASSKLISPGLVINKKENGSIYIKKENISLIFVKLISIEILPDKKELSACGDEANLTTVADIFTIKRGFDGEEIISKDKSEVNPIIRCNNDYFLIDNHMCKVEPNTGRDERKAIITASYAFRGILKNSSVELVQHNNTISDWLTDHEETLFIELSPNYPTFQRNGGQITIKAVRNYVRYNIRKDSCGNIIETMVDKGLTQDISTLCEYEYSNHTFFNMVSNVISALPQKIGSKERYCTVIGRFDGSETSLTISQENGEKLDYSYELHFLDGSKEMTSVLKDSKETVLNIPIVSNKIMSLNGKELSKIVEYDIKTLKYDGWANIEIDDNLEEPSLRITIPQNKDSVNGRETLMEIYNPSNMSDRLKLNIRQPKNKCFKTTYGIIFDGETNYTTSTIKGAKIRLKPFKINHYEDGSELMEKNIPYSYKLVGLFESEDENVLGMSRLIQTDFDGSCESRLIYNNNGSQLDKDISMTIRSRIIDDMGYGVCDDVETIINLKADIVLSYDYIFICNGSDNISLEWVNDNSIKNLDVISARVKYVNGIKEEIEPVSFSLSKCKHFGIQKDNLGVYPIADYQVSDELILTQHDSGKNITISLNNIIKEDYLDIEINVSMAMDDIKCNHWISNSPNLVIFDLTKNNMVFNGQVAKGWIYPDSGEDIIFNGHFNLIIGHDYMFKIDNIMIASDIDEELQEVNFNESYPIEDDDEGIDLYIKLN